MAPVYMEPNSSAQSVEVKNETVSHVGILDGTRREGCNETNSPEGESKDQGAYGQDEAAH